MRNSRRRWLRWAPCRSNQEALVRLERRHKCFYDCFKIGLLARNSACCECNSRIWLLKLGYAGSWLRGEGGRAGVSTTRRRRPAAYLLTFPHDSVSKQKRFTRAYQDVALRIYYLHCVSPFLIGTPLCSSASRLLSVFLLLPLSIFLSLSFFFFSLSFFISLSLFRKPVTIYLIWLSCMHTRHIILYNAFKRAYDT